MRMADCVCHLLRRHTSTLASRCKQLWVPNGHLNNFPSGLRSQSGQIFGELTSLFCRGRPRNVPSFKTLVLSYYSTHKIFCFATSSLTGFADGSFTNKLLFFFVPFFPSLSLVNFCLLLKIFHFWFRTPAAKINSAKITQLVSLVSQSKDIDARALLDSRENIVKKVSFRFQHNCRSDIHASTTLLPVGWLTERLIVKRVSRLVWRLYCTPSCFCKGGGVSYNHSLRFISTSL